MGAMPAAGGGGIGAPVTAAVLTRKIGTFGVLFLCSALLHAAEVAITTLYPWKVKEIADAEGPKSAFALLNKDVTRVLTTILVCTTFCNIVSTTLFADIAVRVCDGSARKLAYSTAGLTAMTLFFGELLPKAIGVNNAEPTARLLVPPINVMTKVLGPVATSFASLSKRVLRRLGLVSKNGGDSANAVSEEELRLIVGGASESGGIETSEGTMIEGVLDLQDTRVSEIMQPRVNVKALERNETMLSFLDLVKATGHSRVPVYDDEIDKIIGVVNAKKLLRFLEKHDDDEDDESESAKKAKYDPSAVLVGAFVDETYFVPETMLAWKVLEEMRKRRLHMAVVVDEHGGTAGMVTLEDILEVVVGEIYDEDDTERRDVSDFVDQVDAHTFVIKGAADLDDVADLLDLRTDEGGPFDADSIPDVTTAAGFLCFHAGEIPALGDHVIVYNYDFEIIDADDRRIERILAVHLDAPGVLEKRVLPDLCDHNDTATAPHPAGGVLDLQELSFTPLADDDDDTAEDADPPAAKNGATDPAVGSSPTWISS